jgi:hypothetical protein
MFASIGRIILWTWLILSGIVVFTVLGYFGYCVGPEGIFIMFILGGGFIVHTIQGIFHKFKE